MSKYLLFTLFSFFSLSLFLSCKSTKTQDSNERTLIIELNKKFNEDYISENYEVYKPLKIKRTNKSLNQYLAKFDLDAVWYKGLLNKLNEDPNVIKVIENNNTKVDKPSTSVQYQKSKARPEAK